jgi:hypothetical protein
MYEDEDRPKKPKKNNITIEKSSAKVVKIQIDGKEILIPDIFYITNLEARLKSMEDENKHLKDTISSLKTKLYNIENHLRR